MAEKNNIFLGGGGAGKPPRPPKGLGKANGGDAPENPAVQAIVARWEQHLRYFYERTDGNGSQFCAVTDPGSPLVELARERGFRHVFENDPDIGGRYSALSFFGLVPAARAAAINLNRALRTAG